MKKKLLCLALTGAMVTSIFAGCGSSEQAAAPAADTTAPAAEATADAAPAA